MKLPVLILAVGSLIGCLGATTRIVIDADGTGTVEVSYRISKLIAYIGAEAETRRYITLPITEDELVAMVDDIDDVTLGRYSFDDGETDITVTATFEFSSFDGLSALFTMIDGPVLEIDTTDDTTTLRCTIYRGLDEPPGDTVTEMVSSFFSDYELDWRLTAPREIVEVSIGDRSGRTASAVFNTAELLLSEEPVVWEVSW